MTDSLVRAFSPEDVAEAREFISREFGRTRYAARLHEMFDDAARGGEDECIVLARAPSLAGLALFRPVAGAHGTLAVHLVAGVDAAACAELAAAMTRRGARLLVAEVPDDEIFAPMVHALAIAGFREEGRVADLISDGVALRLLVSRSAGSP